jgi:hypothetical protein
MSNPEPLDVARRFFTLLESARFDELSVSGLIWPQWNAVGGDLERLRGAIDARHGLGLEMSVRDGDVETNRVSYRLFGKAVAVHPPHYEPWVEIGYVGLRRTGEGEPWGVSETVIGTLSLR